MSYETLTVRMNRSSVSIPWGITLRGSTQNIAINAIEKDSLAEKAGILPNDVVTEIQGHRSGILTLSKARNLLLEQLFEINLVLSRYIVSHPSLPWALTEKENKIVVDEVNPLKDSQSQNTYASKLNSSVYESSRKDFTSKHHTDTSLPRPIALGYEPVPFKSPTSTSAYDGNVLHKQESFQNEYNTSSYTREEKFADDKSYKPAPFTTNFSAQDQSKVTSTYYTNTSENPKPVDVNRLAQSYAQKTFSHSVPVQINASKKYRAVFPSKNRGTTTTFSQQHEQRGLGTPFYHSPRTVRQLSPTASIKYLSSNPANVSYAYETPVDEYLRKTGGLFGTDPNLSKGNQSPYMTSETRRLIAEQEHGLERSVSPAAQSSSFKRISRAVGTPVS